MTRSLEFRILGPLEVWSRDRELEVAAGRHRALLAGLLLRANHVVATDQLAWYMWGEAPPRDARATTQTYVRRLRGLLGDGLIQSRPGGYLISLTPAQLDLAHFDELLKLADEGSDPIQERAMLADALSLWRGGALANVPSDVLHRDEVPALAERRLCVLERRISLDLDAGWHGDLVAELRALTIEHPLRERFWAQLMVALAGGGRRAEALAAYRDLRACLADELGVDPSRDVQVLHQAILRGDFAPPAELRRRRGRAHNMLPVPPGQLPPDVAAFTGRLPYLEQLDCLLTEVGGGVGPGVALLTGPAGVGKTALAVHWAQRSRDRFPDGQLYVDLRGYSLSATLAPGEVLARFLRALGVSPERVPSDVDEAAAIYRSLLADRRVLILLDNASDASQVRPLLPGGPGCMVLVTCRHQLSGLVARDGAHPITLNVLTPDESQTLLARLLGTRRVRAETDAAAKLATLCGHLPLASRIAAAVLRMHPNLSIAAYTEELRRGDRMAVLTTPGDEQATVRAAFDLSYSRLTEPGRRAFRLLALAPGPYIAGRAAAALFDTTTEEAERLLSGLSDAHLINCGTDGRYSFHDLLRLYAADCLRRDGQVAEWTAATERLYAHYLVIVDAATRLLYPHVVRATSRDSGADIATRTLSPQARGPSSPDFARSGVSAGAGLARALAWLDAELPNLVATVTRAAADDQHETAWRLADALRGYFDARCPAVEWEAVARAGLAAAEADGSVQAQAAMQLSLAGLGWRQSRYKDATKHAARALALSRRACWTDGEAAALCRLGTLHLDAGKLPRAIDHLTRAHALYVLTSQQQQHALVLGNLAVVYLWMGGLKLAAQHAKRALSVSSDLGFASTAATNLVTIGEVHHASGRFEQALDHVQRALERYRAVGNKIGEGATLCSLADFHRDVGRYSQALKLAESALRLASETRHVRLEAGALNALASVQIRLSKPEDARDAYLRSRDLSQQTGNRYPKTEALIGLATANLHLGCLEEADAFAQQALAISRDAGYQLLEGAALIVLAETSLANSHARQAAGHVEQALAIYCDAGHHLGHTQAGTVLARVSA